MNNKKIFALVVSLVIVLGIVFAAVSFVKYKMSFGDVTVDFKNSHEVKIYAYDTHDDDGAEQSATKIHTSGEIVKLKKNTTYVAEYTGDEGYQSDVLFFNVIDDEKKITINPYYSEKKLATTLDGEVSDLHTVLNNTYPNMSLYQIQQGKLYHWGEWYGTTLQYIGNDEFNADTLRVVMHKKNGVWEVATNPPAISLSKFVYPDVPTDILSDVNNFQKTPILKRFTGEQ